MKDSSNDCNISNFKVIKSTTINNVTIELLQYSKPCKVFQFISNEYRYTYFRKRLSNASYVVYWRGINTSIKYIPFANIVTFSKADRRFNLLVNTINLNKTKFITHDRNQ